MPACRAINTAPGDDEPVGSAGMPEPAEQLLTSKELADYLGVSARTIRRWHAEGRIKAIRIGRTVRFRLSDIVSG